MNFRSLNLRNPIIISVGVTWALWLLGMASFDLWHHLLEGWPMAVTMVFGAFIAGSTSEGGGAIAFPVMTLILDIKPAVARDFSLMCQAVGMASASLTILWLRVPVSMRAILYSGLGGFIGVVIGMTYIAPLLQPAYAKMFFTSFWLSFAGALFLINRDHERQVYEHLVYRHWKCYLSLFVVGIIGGIISGITGSGLDITTFAFLVLGMRMCEKVATPTSVVLMASNSIFAFFWRSWISETPMNPAAWTYWYAAVPVVCLFAPLGAMFIKDKSRHFVAAILYSSILAQFFGALWIVPQTAKLLLFSGATLTFGLSLFLLGARGGRRFEQLAQEAKPST